MGEGMAVEEGAVVGVGDEAALVVPQALMNSAVTTGINQ